MSGGLSGKSTQEHAGCALGIPVHFRPVFTPPMALNAALALIALADIGSIFVSLPLAHFYF